MPNFDLFSTLPGIQGEQPVVALTAAQSTTVKVRLNDGILFMPEGEWLTFTATLTPGDIVILQAQLNPPKDLFGGHILLQTLKLTLKTVADAGGVRVVDPASPNAVKGTGKANAQGAVIDALGAGDASGKLGLRLEYSLAAGERGFVVTVDPVPVSAKRVKCILDAGRFEAQILPEESAVVITVSGKAKLEQAVEQKVKSVLQTVFGPAGAINLNPEFRYRRKFSLTDTGLPGAALPDLPTFSLFPTWLGNTPKIAGAPDNLGLDLGNPLFTFSLPDLTAIPFPEIGDLNLRFLLRGTRIRFPELAGLEAFELLGNLQFVDGPGPGEWSFGFEPLQAGAIALPDFLHFFLAQLGWLQGNLPDLDDLEKVVALAQQDYSWYRLLEGLLPTPAQMEDFEHFVSDVFPTALSGLINAVLALPDGPSLDRLFGMLFSQLSKLDPTSFTALAEKVWDAWLAKTPNLDPLVELLFAMATNLSPEQLLGALEALLSRVNLDQLSGLLARLLKEAADRLGGDMGATLLLWLAALLAAAKRVEPDRLAEALMDTLNSASGSLATFRTFADLGFPIGEPLNAPTFRLPAGVLLTGIGLVDMSFRSGLDATMLQFPATQAFLKQMFDPLARFINRFFVQAPISAPDSKVVAALLFALMNNAEGDEESERTLLQLGRIFPLGILLALVAAIASLFRGSAWVGLLFKSIEEQSNLNVKRLPAPSETGSKVKYLIFSDTHRESRDDRRELFEFGSIDHFLSNQELYIEILKHARGNGYTVIEAGDCEELWFIRDFSVYKGPAEEIKKILDTHTKVYEQLALLHKEERYFRLYGNHDSSLRKPEVFKPLADKFKTLGVDNLKIYDYFIIDGVKTMDEHNLLDLLADLWAGITSPTEVVKTMVDRVADGRLGFDSRKYTEKKPLIVTHGHQWDFWNCDQNNLTGKLIANSIAVPADSFDDPWVDMGGIALGGSPFLDFAKGFAQLPVFKNFPSYQPARANAQQIQSMIDSQRALIDDEMYFETLPALIGLLAMPLTVTDELGKKVPWSQEPVTPDNLKKVLPHFFNQLCIGHTHYPQSHPYFNFEKLLFGPLLPIVDILQEEISKRLFNLPLSLNVIKSRYYNSGTAGWHEGVIWAIEVRESGQARLVFWTRDTPPNRPQVMDWELQEMDPVVRAALDRKTDEALAWLNKLFLLFKSSSREISKLIGATASMPLELFLAGLAAPNSAGPADPDPAGPAEPDRVDRADPIFADPALADVVNLDLSEPMRDVLSIDGYFQEVSGEINRVGQFLLATFVTLLKRQVAPQAEDPDGAGPTMSMSVPLPETVRQRLNAIEGTIAGLPGIAADQLLPAALLCLYGGQGLQFIGGSRDPLGDLKNMAEQAYPVLWSVLALLPLLPGPGSNAPIAMTVTRSGDRLVVNINIK